MTFLSLNDWKESLITWKTFEEFSLEMNLRNTIQKDELVDIRWYRMLIIPISVIDIHDE